MKAPKSSAEESLLRFERWYWGIGYRRLAGVDEAGRGPLAGPVVAAAVVIDRAVLEAEEHGLLSGLTDSKQLAPEERELFFNRLQSLPDVAIGVGMADNREIDELNILRATQAAMVRAVANLPSPPDYILVDGPSAAGLPPPASAIVRGDAQSLSIAAASIVAKVVRDRHMAAMDKLYPGYGFAQHKGYGTAAHIQALLQYGPCPAHRRTFRPVRDAAEIKSRVERSRGAVESAGEQCRAHGCGMSSAAYGGGDQSAGDRIF